MEQRMILQSSQIWEYQNGWLQIQSVMVNIINVINVINDGSRFAKIKSGTIVGYAEIIDKVIDEQDEEVTATLKVRQVL